MRKKFVVILMIMIVLGILGSIVYFLQSVPSKQPINEQQPVVGGDRDIHGCIGSAGYSWCESLQKCLRVWEEPCNAPTNADTGKLIESIRSEIIAKRGKDAGNLTYTVRLVMGNYAQGGAAASGQGGGMWFAAKVNGQWKLVWDGNGIIECSDLLNYPDFPTKLIPQCFDTAKNEVVNR